MKKWSEEKARQWYESRPWIRGFNGLPSNCVNSTAMWQSYNHDETAKQIEREFALAKQTGLNAVRTVLSFELWLYEHDSYMKNFADYLDAAEKYGLTASQLHTAYSYMKDSLEEGDLGVEKQNNFADMQIRYRDMGLDSEGNFKEKSGGVTYEKPTLEQMTLLMQNLRDGLSGGQFGSGNQNKAIGLMKGLRNALAKQIKENEVELAAKGGWFDQTVSEYVQQGVLEKLKQDFGDIEIPDEEVADLYFSVWGQLQKQNMNLNSVDRADKTAAKIVLLDTYKNRVEDKYFLTKDGAGAVLTSEGALLNVGTGKTPGALRLQEPNGYRREEINGRAVMVRRDKNNEIIDSYEISPLLVRGF